MKKIIYKSIIYNRNISGEIKNKGKNQEEVEKLIRERNVQEKYLSLGVSGRKQKKEQQLILDKKKLEKNIQFRTT